jgi:hypothetical protein
MKNNKECPWCHADAKGDYAMYKFNHPTNPKISATLSVYGGKLVVEITKPDGDNPDRLACDISYCPMCGREYPKG